MRAVFNFIPNSRIHLIIIKLSEKGLMTFIFTGLFSARFRLTIHDRFTEGPSVFRSDSITSKHTLFSNTVANSCLSRTYTIQVKNAVVLEERIDDILWRV